MVFGAGVRARLAAFPVFVLVIPLRCSLVAPLRDTGAIGPSAATPKQERGGDRIAPASPVTPPAPPVVLPDAVVVRAMDTGQQAFLRCWARALRSDVPPTTGKVRLHLEIDEGGHVIAARSDSDAPALSRCLAVVARGLLFPSPGRPAVVEVPLMFR